MKKCMNSKADVNMKLYRMLPVLYIQVLVLSVIMPAVLLSHDLDPCKQMRAANVARIGKKGPEFDQLTTKFNALKERCKQEQDQRRAAAKAKIKGAAHDYAQDAKDLRERKEQQAAAQQAKMQSMKQNMQDRWRQTKDSARDTWQKIKSRFSTTPSTPPKEKKSFLRRLGLK